MNQESKPSSSSSGRILAGGLGVSLLLLGVSESKRDDLQGNYNSLEKAKNEVVTTNGKLNLQIDGLDRQIVSLQGAYDKKAKELTANQLLLTAANENGDKLGKDLKAAIADRDDKKAKLASTEATLQTTSDNLAASEAREGKLKTTVATLEKANGDLNVALETKTKQLDESKQREETLVAKVADKDQKLALAAREVESLKGDVLAGVNREQALKGGLTSVEKEKQDLLNTLNDRTARIEQLDKGLMELNKALAEHQNQNNALTKTNETLAKERQDLMAAREVLQKQVDELNNQIKSMSEQSKAQQSSMLKLESEKKALELKQQEMIALTEKAGAERDAARQQREQIQNTSNELIAKLEQLSSKVSTLEKDFVSLRDVKTQADSALANQR